MQPKKIEEEAAHTFSKKADHFTGTVTQLRYIDNEKAEHFDEDAVKEIVTTVSDKLSFVSKSVIKHIDVVLQKDSTNAVATADLVVDDVVVAVNLPAVFLLSLENKLKNLRAMYNVIPTLKPGIPWYPGTEKNVSIAPTTKTTRTEKVPVHEVVVPATDNHPAQVSSRNVDVPVAKILKTESSSMITPLV